jgi:carbonic anhydrase
LDETRDETKAEASVSEPGGALASLTAGNGRFLASIEASTDPAAVRAGLSRAEPYAVILGCSDSRVPPEVVFGEAPGRLFVVRVASGVAGPNEIGTIEYALARWSCPLVVVLGHTQCGGIAASLDRLPAGAEAQPEASGWMHMGSLVFAIRSAMGDTSACAACSDPWRAAVELHVHKSVDLLQNWSEPIRRRVAAGRLKVIGAIYDVETGAVELLDA